MEQVPADPATTKRTAAGRPDDASARRLHAVIAGHQGDAAAAMQALADEDAAVRAAGIGALARCGALSAEHIQVALCDEAAQVRRRALELAPTEIDLTPMLDDPEASVVEAAASALGERDWDQTAVPHLCRTARHHGDPLCRESAIAALGAIAAGSRSAWGGTDSTANDPASNTGNTNNKGNQAPDGELDETDETVLGALLAALDDRPQIRRRALLGLHQFGDQRAVDAVRASLCDRDRQVRAIAGELLGVAVR